MNLTADERSKIKDLLKNYRKVNERLELIEITLSRLNVERDKLTKVIEELRSEEMNLNSILMNKYGKIALTIEELQKIENDEL